MAPAGAPMTAQQQSTTASPQPQRELPIYYERLLQSVRYVVLKSHVTYPEYIAGTSNNRRDSIKFMEWLMKENPTAKVRAIGLDEYILESKPFEPRPHTPVQGTSKLCFGTQHPASECCQQCNELETCKQKQRYLDYDKKEAARTAALATLDKEFPENTIVNANGDLKDGWELDPKPLFKLKKKMQSDPRYIEEPEAEVIEAVILAIKESLRAAGEQE
jgi:hypothetical protein